MALNKDVLGLALYNEAASMNETDVDPADMEAYRLRFWKKVAQAIITHIQTQGVVQTTGSAAAQTGKML